MIDKIHDYQKPMSFDTGVAKHKQDAYTKMHEALKKWARVAYVGYECPNCGCQWVEQNKRDNLQELLQEGLYLVGELSDVMRILNEIKEN